MRTGLFLWTFRNAGHETETIDSVAQTVERPVEAGMTRVRAPPGSLTDKQKETSRVEVQLGARGLWEPEAVGSIPTHATFTNGNRGLEPNQG